MRHHLRVPGLPAILCALFCLLLASPAFAQFDGRFIVGAGASATFPASDELESGVSIGYSIGTVPREGWGLAWAFNWYGADVKGESVGSTGRFGRLSVRPIMAGIGYTHIAGRVSVAPSIVAGPALTTLRLDSSQRPAFAVEGDEFERKIGTFSFAVRPAVTVNYALTPRFGLSGTAGYIFNTSKLTLSTPAGSVEKEWDTNAFNIRAGVIVSLF